MGHSYSLMKKTSVFILHNTTAPYRLALFEALAQEFDVYVAFGQTQKVDRQWQVDLMKYAFNYKALKHVSIKLGRKEILLNYSLIPLLFSRNYDVYIVGRGAGMLLSMFATQLIARLRNKPVILWSGNVAAEIKSSVSLADKLKALFTKYVFHKWPNAYIAYGEEAAKYLHHFGVEAEKIFKGTQVLWPDNHLEPTLSRVDLALDQRQVILCLSYLNARKSVQYLLSAFQALDRDDVILVIAGDGPDRAALEKQADAAENIRFVGYVEGTVKASYYAAADIFALPTSFDVWGLVVNEAMHYGLPIIITSGANCTELLQDNALVVAPKSAEALQNALAELLDKPERQHQMGQLSRTIIKDYNGQYAVTAFIEAVTRVSR